MFCQLSVACQYVREQCVSGLKYLGAVEVNKCHGEKAAQHWPNPDLRSHDLNASATSKDHDEG